MQLTGHGNLGRQFYGLLPIHGKIPNAKINDSSILEHEEVKNIIASLGLENGACYSSAKKLRYGHLMLMMDQVCVALSLWYFEFIVAYLMQL